ncbi:MAG: hypothetical protein JHC84_05360 [Solirubrobacteraceae bacterium]|nr:hypothetical protein [Solirubrobacteraceae bacterium]
MNYPDQIWEHAVLSVMPVIEDGWVVHATAAVGESQIFHKTYKVGEVEREHYAMYFSRPIAELAGQGWEVLTSDIHFPARGTELPHPGFFVLRRRLSRPTT